MKILFFRGDFSAKENSIYTGLICWCHLEPSDVSNKDLIVALFEKAELFRKKEEDIIIVPFGYLDISSNRMPFVKSKQVFRIIAEHVKHFTYVKIIPIKNKNELRLKVPSYGFVDFLEI